MYRVPADWELGKSCLFLRFITHEIIDAAVTAGKGEIGMKTQIKKNGDTLVVSMDGRLDFETSEPLRAELSKIIRSTRNTDTAPKKIIFNLEGLEFVGSSGISSFIQTLKEFNAMAPEKPRYCNVKSEFKRVIKAFDEESLFEFHDSEARARDSFDDSIAKGLDT